MDWVMEEIPEQIFAAASSTTTTPTTTTTVDDDLSWDEWSPDLSWSDEDIQPLILASAESELESAFIPAAGNPSADFSPHFIQGWSSNTSSVITTSSGGFSAEGLISPVAFPDEANKGERLLHLLTAAAEALSGDHSTRDLARVILVRLKELNTGSSGMERLIAHFTVALQGLLDGDVAGGSAPRRGDTDKLPYHQYPAEEVLTAFHLLQDMSPFASFGHLTANQAILEASAGERRVHIIDYDIAEGVHWASLIQAMASGTNKTASSAAPTHLKITAITNGSWKSATRAQDAGRRLSAFAESVGQPFSFRMCRLNQKKRFQPAAVKVVKGELVVVNCALHPAQLGHAHCSSASVCSFLAGAAELGARLITIVEEEAVAVTSDEKGSFFRRFMNELERYTAVWESLEAGFPKQERVRDMVERVLLGPRIAEALRRAYGRNNGLEPAAEGCGKWMAAAGFEKIGLSYFNLCQARLLLGLFNDGYRVEEEASNKLVLSWKSCRLISASVWTIPAAQSPSPSPSPSPSLSPSPPFGSIYL